MQAQITLQQAIQDFENKNLSKFKPSKEFYAKTRINRIRFWQLVEGKKPMLASEVKSLTEFFQVPITEII